jgi:hypothetical protein
MSRLLFAMLAAVQWYGLIVAHSQAHFKLIYWPGRYQLQSHIRAPLHARRMCSRSRLVIITHSKHLSSLYSNRKT